MQSTLECPKCSGQKFAMTGEFRIPRQDCANMTAPFPPIAFDWLPSSRTCRQRTTVGTVATWICLGCGYTEFYARNLDGVVAVANQHPDQVRIIDATPGSLGTYR